MSNRVPNNIIGQIICLLTGIVTEVLGDHHVAELGKNFDILHLEVQSESIVVSPTTMLKSLEVSFFLSRTTSLITPNSNRQVRNTIDRSSPRSCPVVEYSRRKKHPRWKSDRLIGRSHDHCRICEEILGTSITLTDSDITPCLKSVEDP